jgi:hypothetical protein
MPISFTVIADGNYVISKWEGKITDDEMLRSYKEFYEGPNWSRSLNELVVLGNTLNVEKITNEGLTALADYVAHHFTAHNVQSSKTAVFSRNDLSFGLARVYEAFAYLSPEEIDVFRDLEKAKSWITGDPKD